MVRLRKLEPSDLPFLYQWENDRTVWRDGDTHNPLSQQDLRAYIESTTGDIYRDGQLRLIIEERSGEKQIEQSREKQTEPEQSGDRQGGAEVLTIGCIDLFDLDVRNRKAAIGLYIAPEFRRHGYAKEAVSALKEYAFEVLCLRLLYVHIGAWNTPCLSLFEQLGFERVAVLPEWALEGDVEVYMIRS